MPILLQYMLKLSISLAIMYLFYRLVLRRLTFYNHNRWYLFGYSVFCFIVSAINISPLLEKDTMEQHDILVFFPSVEKLTANASTASVMVTDLSDRSNWNWLLVVIMIGCLVMLLRLSMQLISFKRMVKNAKLITDEEIKFYQVNKNIIPFSFGNAIFINQQLLTEAELKEIIKHEFVHVKQLHTIDIVWAEILCILNWYNPFAWLIRSAIRQNLEFIADSKVLEKGMDKRRYQYLLLKVIGDNHFSIVSQFNFSSLKKRIVMMNKISNAKVHLLKFLFVLPLITIALLAFRKEEQSLKYAVIVYDAETLKPVPNVRVKGIYNNVEYTTDAKGYIEIPASIDKENKMHISYDFSKEGYIKSWNRRFETDFKNGKPHSIIELISIKKGADNGFCDICGAASQNYYDNRESSLQEDAWQFFDMLMKAKKSRVVTIDTVSNLSSIDAVSTTADERDRLVSEFLNRNMDVKEVGWVYDNVSNNKMVQIHIIKKAGANEVYDINNQSEMSEFERKYGSEMQYYLLRLNLIHKNREWTKPDTIPGELNKKNKLTDASLDGPANILIRINDKAKPLIFVDNVEWHEGVNINTIDADKIESIDVLKNKNAVEKYGEKGKNGVILITSKKQTAEKPATTGLKIREPNADLDNVLYFINGLESSKEAVEMIDPAKIQSIDVLKGKSAEKKYGEKGKGGVIEITIPKARPAAWDIRNVLPKKKEEC